MNPLRGLGVWIWQLHACEKGDPAAIAARAAQSGIAWVAVRSGESKPDGTVTRALVSALEAGGLTVAAWWYSVPTAIDAQLAHARHLVEQCGVTRLIVDAELEWESVRDTSGGSPRVLQDYRAEARDFAARLRSVVGPDTYLADAPWPKPRAHTVWPFKEFGAVMQQRHPQVYWQEAKESFAHYAGEWEAQWNALLPGERHVCPIGCTVNYDASLRAPPSELGAFLDRYESREAHSLWSWQHLNAVEWALLAQREKARTQAGDTIVDADNPPVFAAPDPGGGDDKPPSAA